jgi:hypothetical protein
MKDAIDRALADRFQLQADMLPGADLEDVRSRAATLLGGTKRGRNRRRLVVAVAAAALSLAAATVTIAGALLTADSQTPVAPAGITALRALPPVSDPPSRLIHIIEGSSTRLDGSSTEAERTLRRVGSDLGTTATDLYAYDIGPLPNTAGRDVVCLAVWDRSVVCQTAADALFPDALVSVTPGGPGYNGLPNDTAAIVAGLVDDDIRSVVLDESGYERALPITNNAFFAELAPVRDGQLSIKLRITYADGSTKSWTYR